MSRCCRWAGLALAVIALLSLGTTLPAGAAHARMPSVVFATAEATPSVVAPCGETSIDGEGWEPRAEVTINLDGAQGETLSTVVVDADGSFAARVEIPCDTSVGPHAIGIFGHEAEGDIRALEIPIEVVAGHGGTPASGSDVAAGIGMTLSLLALGIVTITTTRRTGGPPIRQGVADG